MTAIPAGTSILEIAYKESPTALPFTGNTGGRLPALERGWRIPGECHGVCAMLERLENYLLAAEDGPMFPYGFVQRVIDVASEALINAGKYAQSGSEVQINCHVVGLGAERRCTVSVYNLVDPAKYRGLPAPADLPSPDLGGDQEHLERLLRDSGRGLAIMRARADAFYVREILGIAVEACLVFDLNSSLS